MIVFPDPGGVVDDLQGPPSMRTAVAEAGLSIDHVIPPSLGNDLILGTGMVMGWLSGHGGLGLVSLRTIVHGVDSVAAPFKIIGRFLLITVTMDAA